MFCSTHRLQKSEVGVPQIDATICAEARKLESISTVFYIPHFGLHNNTVRSGENPAI